MASARQRLEISKARDSRRAVGIGARDRGRVFVASPKQHEGQVHARNQRLLGLSAHRDRRRPSGVGPADEWRVAQLSFQSMACEPRVLPPDRGVAVLHLALLLSLIHI